MCLTQSRDSWMSWDHHIACAMHYETIRDKINRHFWIHPDEWYCDFWQHWRGRGDYHDILLAFNHFDGGLISLRRVDGEALIDERYPRFGDQELIVSPNDEVPPPPPNEDAAYDRPPPPPSQHYAAAYEGSPPPPRQSQQGNVETSYVTSMRLTSPDDEDFLYL